MREDFIPIVINTMNDAEKITTLSGSDKKDFVMMKIRTTMTPETYETYTPMLSIIIDGLCKVRKEHIEMTFNKISKNCCK